MIDATLLRSGEVHIRICGELDLSTHATLVDQLARADLAHATTIRLHLSGLTFCDAHGGVLLLRFIRRMHDAGRVATIEHPQPHVSKLLTLVMLIAPNCKI